MKVADLLDEHGLKSFRGDRILFGILWGIFGALIILRTNEVVAAVLVALTMACIVRNRLDYLNHQIAATIIFITALWYRDINFIVFMIFFGIFVVFGGIKDYFDDVVKKQGVLGKLSEMMLYYPIPTFIYCSIYGNWLLFWIFTLYTIAYNVTKGIAKKKGYR